MSRENVELVRRLYEAVARGDTETVLALYDPEVEWDASRSPLGRVTGTTVYRGHDGLRAAFREWYEGWEHVDDDVAELIDAGDTVIAVATLRGRGRLSGADVVWKNYAAAWTIRGGRVVRVIWFPSRAEAIAATARAE